MTLTAVPVLAESQTVSGLVAQVGSGEARESKAEVELVTNEVESHSRGGGQNLFVGQKPSTARPWQVVCGSCFIFCPAILS